MTLLDSVPFAPIVKLDDADPAGPEDGEDEYVSAVAAVEIALYVMLEGFDKPPLLVTEMVLLPADEGVYVNEPDVEPLVSVNVVGLKVPPAPPSLGVTMTLLDSVPFAPIAKFAEAAPTLPDVGLAEYVSAVAAGLVAVYVIAEGLVKPPLLLSVIDFAPELTGVYVNEPDVVPLDNVNVDGVNVPPAPLSLGVTVTLPLNAPLVVTLNAAEAAPTLPDVGLAEYVSAVAYTVLSTHTALSNVPVPAPIGTTQYTPAVPADILESVALTSGDDGLLPDARNILASIVEPAARISIV
jgi:hypothetical protein